MAVVASPSRARAAGPRRVLLTGATGYVGGRLLPVLEARGLHVRCLTRHPETLTDRVGATTTVVPGDVTVPSAVRAALSGVDVAYYLVHAMGAGEGFAEEDRKAAHVFSAAAREEGVGLIVYLGALGSGTDLSSHLASRQEVGAILRASGVPTIELRSSIIIGAGSLSYEMIRSLVTRLPVMLTPRWVRTMTQPIAIADVVEYLVAALELPDVTTGRVYEIGGRDRVSYSDLMREFAGLRGLRRIIVPVPVLSPWLSSLWLNLITPLYARVGRHLIEGVRNKTVAGDTSALNDMPVRPMGVEDAIRQAIADEDDAAKTRRHVRVRRRRARASGHPVDIREVHVAAPPAAAFAPIQCIGGTTGWYYGNRLWQLRGWLDMAFGGVGLRRGRRDPVDLVVGDRLDFWRVEAIEPPRLLRLAAEMKLPGRAWLEYVVEPDGDGARIIQTASFESEGLLGRLYWHAVAPAHALIFPGMLRGIAAASQGTARSDDDGSRLPTGRPTEPGR